MIHADASRVVVLDQECDTCGTDRIAVFHEAFPELRPTGPSATLAAERLASQLTQNLSAVVDPAHRGPVHQALADIDAFLERADALAPVHNH